MPIFFHSTSQCLLLHSKSGCNIENRAVTIRLINQLIDKTAINRIEILLTSRVFSIESDASWHLCLVSHSAIAFGIDRRLSTVA